MQERGEAEEIRINTISSIKGEKSMNSFLQEVITQGDYLKKTAAYYRSEGA